MQPKARITAIRLAEKVAKQPEYAKKIGLVVEMESKNRKRKTMGQSENSKRAVLEGRNADEYI